MTGDVRVPYKCNITATMKDEGVARAPPRFPGRYFLSIPAVTRKDTLNQPWAWVFFVPRMMIVYYMCASLTHPCGASRRFS